MLSDLDDLIHRFLDRKLLLLDSKLLLCNIVYLLEVFNAVEHFIYLVVGFFGKRLSVVIDKLIKFLQIA